MTKALLIRDLLQQGLSQDEIMAKVDCAKSYIRVVRMLDPAYVEKQRIWAARRAKIEELLKDGWPNPAIQDALQVNHTTVYKVRRKLGLTRKNAAYLSPEKKQEVVQLWNEGELGLNEIADIVGLPFSKVEHYLASRQGWPNIVKPFLKRSPDAQPHA